MGQNTKGIGTIIWPMGRESSGMQTVMSMKESGKMIRNMASESITT